MKNYKIKTSFVGPECQGYIICINFMILLFLENCLSFDAEHDFSSVLIQRIVIDFEAKLEKKNTF